MKTINEFYQEVLNNEDLKKEYENVKTDEELDDFLKSHDCEGNAEEVKAFLKGDQEITDDELDNVAGGGCKKNGRPVVTAFNKCGHFEYDWDKAAKGYRLIIRCADCRHSKYTGGLLICFNDKRLNEN